MTSAGFENVGFCLSTSGEGRYTAYSTTVHNNSGRERDPEYLDSCKHASSLNIKFESCKEEIFRWKREHASPHDWKVIKVTLSSSDSTSRT